MLVLVLGLIFTLTESARVSALRARLQSLTYVAADACFSEFAQPVFDDYGVMLLWQDEETFIKNFKEYVSKNLVTEDISLLRYGELFGAGLEEASLLSKKGPLDENGKVFADQVLEYMDTFLFEDAVSRILDNVSIFDQGDKASDFMDKIEDYGSVFKKLEKQVGVVDKKVEAAQRVSRDPADILDEAKDSIEAFYEGDEDAASDFSRSMRKLKSSKNDLEWRLEDIEKATDKYYEYAGQARDATEKLRSELDLNKEDYTDDVYAALSEQLKDLEQKSSDTDFDYYAVVANENTTENYLAKLDSLNGLISLADAPLSEENADEYYEMVNDSRRTFSSFDLSSLSINYDPSQGEKEDDSFLDDVSNLFSKGILEFVAGDISEKKISRDGLPSAEKSSSRSAEKKSLLEAEKDSAIFGEYILTHFGNYASKKEGTALDYEVEYIIAGKSTDRDNLSAIVGDIVLIRSGCNLISILKSTLKKAETLELATALAGCTGMPIVIKIVQILIMGAWALAESIADVKSLMDGHKVPTIKDDGDWYISLAGLKNFSQDSIGSFSYEKGLSYESYLRVLLLGQKDETQYYRTMDVIQANMRANENSEFSFAKCITNVEISANYNAPQLFLTFPFVSTLIDPGDGAFEFNIIQKYLY